MKTETILKIMKFFSWFAFIGLMIKCGVILTSYIASIYKPEMAKNLFEGLNLFEYYNHSFVNYSFLVFYKIILFAIEAYIAYLVIILLKKLNLEKPFKIDIHKMMKKISYAIFYLWVIAIVHNTHIQFIGKKHDFEISLFSSDFVFLSLIIFIFAQIVKRGIEIQSENDLTI
ncbi:DUF2975 domain-containing protein [Polaribacter tangerinus]|uniref:DUF2975 domain-containing protein n=1 Tax=Polaribacter tangerinus TaxID=1920034 RepID=UPI000B4BFCDF|nr:DUF2975 domain-containing protein [Polaribacter tangerinus]